MIIKEIKRKKTTNRIVDFTVPADHQVNIKENEKRDKYMGLARELKMFWNMKVRMTPIIIGAHGTVLKVLVNGLEKLEIEGCAETINSVRILKRVLEICRRSGFSKRLSTNIGEENSLGVIIIIVITRGSTERK